MKVLMKALAPILITCLMFGMTLNFNACSEQSPLQPVAEDDQPTTPDVLQKRLGLLSGLQSILSTVSGYPQGSSVTVNLISDLKLLTGGAMSVPNGSRFSFDFGTLIPPHGMGLLKSLTVSMKADIDSAATEMIFTFGPSGSTFNPPADFIANWSDLNLNDVKFYYIDEEGNYIEQEIEKIDYENKLLKAKISHFSRYAVAWSR